MKTKFTMTKAMKAFADLQDVPPPSAKVLKLIGATKAKPSADDLLEKWLQRDFKVATPGDAWRNLNMIAEAAQDGTPIPPEAALWLLAAMNRAEHRDIEKLIRDLGFIEMGAPKKFDRFKIHERVQELFASGMKPMEASRQAASEFGCHPNLAHRYGFQLDKKSP